MSDETLTAAFNLPNGRVGLAERHTQALPLDDVAVTVSDLPESAKRGASQAKLSQAGLWLLCLIPIVVLAVMGWRQRWMSDDGMINIRVVDQFVAGNGLVYNLGERVEVATSTLWLGMLLLSTVIAPASETSVVAVGMGWLLTLIGMIAGTLASIMLHRGQARVLLPCGAMIVAFLPPMWDFATSGLETGLTFAWIGLCILALVWRLEARPGRHAWAPAWVPVLIGLGPLIRPDLALMVVCFGIALLLQSSRSILGPVVAIVIAGLLPLVWQIFRMGYFASLVPNTALAKSAGGSRWEQGLTYLWDVVGRYGLCIPLSIILLMVFAHAVRSMRSGDLARTAVLLAPVAAGLLHATYIVRVGGDFMHGRLLLPGLFAFALAQAVIPFRHHAKWAITGAVVVAVSSIVAGLFVRFPYFYKWDPNTGIADERMFYTSRTRDGLTLSRHDWRGSHWHKVGTTLHNDAATGQAYYQDGRTILPAADGRGVVYATQNLGVIGVVAGNEVFIADRLALADVVTARIPVAQSDSRVGHARRPAEWRQARYAAPLEDDPASVRDARMALRCGKLAELGEAITQPMSLQRFFENFRKARSFTMLTVPKDPEQARAKFCGSM